MVQGRTEVGIMDAPGKRLPGLQATMADLVAAGAVSYDPARARWYEAGEGGALVEARRARGRTLRELRRGGLITVNEQGKPNESGAVPVVLTAEGRARHTARAAETSG